MARTSENPATRVVRYFREAPLEVAETVMALCRAALGEREGKSRDAKARAVKALRPVRRQFRRKRSVAPEQSVVSTPPAKPSKVKLPPPR